MPTADLTVIGLGRSDPSAGEYIAEIQRRLAADRVPFEMGSRAHLTRSTRGGIRTRNAP